MEKIGGGNSTGGLSKLIPLVSDDLPQGDHRADGVVLKRKEASPKSSDCLLFLRGMGAVWAGTPGPRKRFGGAAEPMTWGSFMLYQGPRRLYLKGVDVAEDFLSVRNSKNSLLCAAKWCVELSARLPLGHENNAVLSLFWGSMKNLSRGLCVPLLDARFAWRWGNVWGVAPSFGQCPGCGAALGSGEPAAMTELGFLCRGCLAKSMAKPHEPPGFRKPVSPGAFEIIKSSCLSPAENFVSREPELRGKFSSNETLAREVKEAARWLFSFLRID
ncbi:MAG: hypothetical protein LBU26_02905 [Synergistaceae bacterium]|jgi:DNA repair protein RecO (recombination protein O)|nr:hypothetical protein [Synergistaceae bacterium]